MMVMLLSNCAVIDSSVVVVAGFHDSFLLCYFFLALSVFQNLENFCEEQLTCPRTVAWLVDHPANQSHAPKP